MNYYQHAKLKWVVGQGIYRPIFVSTLKQTGEGIKDWYLKRKARALIYSRIDTENQNIVFKYIGKAIKNNFVFIMGEGWEHGILTYED